MNGLPEPYADGTHLAVRGRTVVVQDHAPCADGWHYHGLPADLAGDCITFAHHEATPIERPMPTALPNSARNLMANAGLDLDVFDQEHTPLGDLLDVVRLVHRQIPELHQAWVTYYEATA